MVAGVACGLGMLCAYLTQYHLLQDISTEDVIVFKHTRLQKSAIVLFVISIIAFGFGAWEAVANFSRT